MSAFLSTYLLAFLVGWLAGMFISPLWAAFAVDFIVTVGIIWIDPFGMRDED